MKEALGPYGRRIGIDGGRLSLRAGSGMLTAANGALILRRMAFDTGSSKEDADVVLGWAASTNLGQDGASVLRHAAAERRRTALSRLRKIPGRTGRHGEVEPERIVALIKIIPEWRMAIGTADKGGVYDIGISLHGTYGWPIIPAPTLKGLVHRWADTQGADPADVVRVLGLSGEGSDQTQIQAGSVTFFDAAPDDTEPVDVAVDVTTVHDPPYYERHGSEAARRAGGPPAPPTGAANPVHVRSLTLTGRGGALVAALMGPRGDVDLAAGWLTEALDSAGVGAKTAGGYGYAAVERTDLQ